MSYHKYNSAHNRNSHSRQGKFTEATATKRLQDLIFSGVGPRHLGWQFPEYELQDDGTWKETKGAGVRSWETPPKEKRYKWNPLRDHLKGAFRGVVWAGSTHVPFVTVDLDRHSGSVLAQPHIRDVLLTGHLLRRNFSFSQGCRLSWCVEVNPKNGSAKFFGWSTRPIPIRDAQKIGEQIHEAMGRAGILRPKVSREVFPFNHPQVLLPMRIDKTTVIDTGILPKCLRRKRISEDYTYRMASYETYSVLAFSEWLGRGSHFCERTLLATLRKACANLPDQLPEIKKPVVRADPKLPKSELPEPEDNTHSWKYRGSGADNPNSFERQHEALLVLSRQAGRVVTEEEALAYIRANSLFTGTWNQNSSRRRARIRWILKRIAKTFDPAKCRGVRHEISIGKYDQWARHHIGTIKGRDRRDVDEYGNIVVRKNRCRVDWRFVSMFLSVAEFCLVTSPNEDKSLPQVRAQEIWSRCHEGGQTTVLFDEKKWVHPSQGCAGG